MDDHDGLPKWTTLMDCQMDYLIKYLEKKTAKKYHPLVVCFDQFTEGSGIENGQEVDKTIRRLLILVRVVRHVRASFKQSAHQLTCRNVFL